MAKIDIKTLFSDTKKFPDSYVIKLDNDAEIDLGTLRAFDASRGGEVQADLSRQQKALEAERKKLEQSATQVAQLYVNLEDKAQKLAATPSASAATADPLADYEADPNWAPVIKAIRTQQSHVDAITTKFDDTVKKLVDSIGKMGLTYVNDRGRSQFNEIVARKDPYTPKDLSYDALYKFAIDNRKLDASGMPDLHKAYDDMTSQARFDHAVKEAEKRGAESKEREIRESAMLPSPGAGGRQPVAGAEVVNVKNIDDAFKQAAGDKSLWRTIAELNNNPAALQ